MNINMQPGTYVVAVSGGVDSMVLLDLLAQQAKLPIPNHQSPITAGKVRLIVAHFDHGIRHDSYIDRELVHAVAKKHGLPFVYHEGRLGADASEDTARKARYKFLHTVRKASGASAIITAHHHDDMLETAILNMLRGTNRKGLSSLQSSSTVHRPLLHLHKRHLKQYALDQGLLWREDSTNTDTRYARNHVRHQLLPAFGTKDKAKLIDIVNNVARINQELDQQLTHYLHLQPGLDRLSRQEFVRLPHIVAREVLATWLRRHNIRDFDQKTLERLVVAAKTYVPGKRADIIRGHNLLVGKTDLALEHADR